MTLPKRYDPKGAERELADEWERRGAYAFDVGSTAEVFSVDTPPPTVSGQLHLGHMYSYSQADFIARFQRMRGKNVFYRLGFDDNGLPTERLVEKTRGMRAEDVGRPAFIQECLAVSQEIEEEYRRVFRRLGLSLDWSYTYRTISDPSRKASQLSFIRLCRQDRAYRQTAPTIWCPECQTAIAQAEVNDLDVPSEFVTFPFALDDGQSLQISTTRPELLPACVAIFVHPGDARYKDVIGRRATVPLFGQGVLVRADEGAEPEKGTGAVMCCTFGDTVDIGWWRTHELPLRQALDRSGRLTDLAGAYKGLDGREARRRITEALESQGLLLDRRPIHHAVRVHERCDTPVEYILTQQWFIRVLDRKEELLAAGEHMDWHPRHMVSRYRDWVENLHWDWSISRQRYFGVLFPVWYCDSCGEPILASEDQLPVDPTTAKPPRGCECGSDSYTPETDVMDTWATSSLSPQMIGRELAEPDLYARVFPMSMRAQGHDIIRTWAFYTIVKSWYHSEQLPWKNVLISGFGLAPKSGGKMSKSRGGGPLDPLEAFDRYSADGVRYWAASTTPGKDSVISEEKMQAGSKLATKLWNVAGFSGRFLEGYVPADQLPSLSPADRWILSSLQLVVRKASDSFANFDYAAAKNETELFFWTDLADNYLEMAKKRLYDEASEGHAGARYALREALSTVLKLFAPILPYVTDAIYRGLFATDDESIHAAPWPVVNEALDDEGARRTGEILVHVASAVRGYKSDRNLSLGSELRRLLITSTDRQVLENLRGAQDDISSVSRALLVEVGGDVGSLQTVEASRSVVLGIEQ